jgi:hypothetical protein
LEMAQANNYYTTIKIIYNTSKSYDLLLQDIRQNMMGRHVESEAWGGMRRVGRRYLSCSALAAMAFRCAAAKPRHWMCAAPPARTPSVFFLGLTQSRSGARLSDVHRGAHVLDMLYWR